MGSCAREDVGERLPPPCPRGKSFSVSQTEMKSVLKTAEEAADRAFSALWGFIVRWRRHGLIQERHQSDGGRGLVGR